MKEADSAARIAVFGAVSVARTPTRIVLTQTAPTAALPVKDRLSQAE